jgi:hypothetical protein
VDAGWQGHHWYVRACVAALNLSCCEARERKETKDFFDRAVNVTDVCSGFLSVFRLSLLLID